MRQNEACGDPRIVTRCGFDPSSDEVRLRRFPRSKAARTATTVIVLAVVVVGGLLFFGSVLDSLEGSKGTRTADTKEFEQSRKLYAEVLRNEVIVRLAGADPRFEIAAPCAKPSAPRPAQSELTIPFEPGFAEEEIGDALEAGGWTDGSTSLNSDEFGSDLRKEHGAARLRIGDGILEVRRIDADDCVLR